MPSVLPQFDPRDDREEPEVARDERPTARAVATRLSPLGQAVLSACTLAVLVLAVHAPGLTGDFLDQDAPRITENLSLRVWAGIRPIWRAPHHFPDFSPLTYTTHLVEAQLFGVAGGRAAVGFRAVNLLIHLAGVLLLWHLLRRLQVPGAFVATAVFAVHPATVSTVAWVSQRPALLGTLLGLASLTVFLRLAGLNPSPAEPHRWLRLPERPALLWAIVVGLLLLTAAASPALAAAVGPVAVVLVWWERGRVSAADWRRASPLLAIAGAMVAAGLFLASRDLPPWEALRLDGVPAGQRPLAAAMQWAAYLFMTLWPVGLRFASEPMAVGWGTTSLGVAAAAGVVIAAVAVGRRYGRGPIAGLAIFTLLLLPSLLWVDQAALYGGWVGPHRLYPASAAVIVGLTAVAADLLTRGRASAGRAPLRVALGLGGVAVLAVGALGLSRALALRSPAGVWEHVLAGAPDHAVALLKRGELAQRAGDEATAERCFVQANRLRPHDPAPLVQLGGLYGRRAAEDPSRRLRARDAFIAALAAAPEDVEAMRGLASILQLMGDSAGALRQLEAARALRPRDPLIYNDIGFAHFQRGEWQRAVDAYLRAIELDPRCTPARINLATAYFQAGRQADAEVQLVRAVEVDPQNWQTFMNAGAMLGQRGSYPRAAQLLRHAAKLHDGSADLWSNLGSALVGWSRQPGVTPAQRLGLLGEAVFCFERAAELAPRNPSHTEMLQQVRRERAARSSSP